jgi:hypothetical protein
MGNKKQVRYCVGHAPLRSRLINLTRCTHTSGRMESLAFGHAFKHIRRLRLYPGIRPHEVRSRSSSTVLLIHAVAFVGPCRKSFPPIHILCRITAGLRATAVTARRWSFVFASRNPQTFSDDHSAERTTSDCATT